MVFWCVRCHLLSPDLAAPQHPGPRLGAEQLMPVPFSESPFNHLGAEVVGGMGTDSPRRIDMGISIGISMVKNG